MPEHAVMLNCMFVRICDAFIEHSKTISLAPLSPRARQLIHQAHQSAKTDPLGDADQSDVTKEDEDEEALRNAWVSGLNFQKVIESNQSNVQFHVMCFYGQADAVEKKIQETKEKTPNDLSQLLESRASYLRLTPLHFAATGARDRQKDHYNSRHAQVMQALIDAGARVDAKDIAGFTPLATLTGFGATPYSLSLASILADAGAKLQVTNRLGLGILMPALMENNQKAFRTLLDLGANVDQVNYDGETPRSMVRSVPMYQKIIMEYRRQEIHENMKCAFCSASNATKHCGACRLTYYCSKDCQRADWKMAHKDGCKKDSAPEDYVDVDIGRDTTNEPVPGVIIPKLSFANFLNSKTSSRQMKPKHDDSPFVVKITLPNGVDSIGKGAIKINEENSDYLLIKGSEEEDSLYCELERLINEHEKDMRKIYLIARWIHGTARRPRSGSGNMANGVSYKKMRIYTSVIIPPPSPAW